VAVALRGTPRGGILPSLAAALLFAAAWLLLHPAEPWPADADAYDHLAAARNLLRGDGLSNDLIYPVTLAWDWGRQLPQPMLQRPPGFTLLLTAPVAAAHGDPAAALPLVRWLQVLLITLTAAVGWRGLARRDASAGGPVFLVLLLASPLMALGVAWGWSEVPAGLLLLLLWLGLRPDHDPDRSRRRALLLGLAAGLLTLTRTELTWVPLLWWASRTVLRRRTPRDLRDELLVLGVAAAVWLVVTLPWWWHVTLVAGSPFFNPSAYALQLDLGEAWWEYPRLRGLEPLAPLDNLRENLGPALLKVRHGVRFFARTLHAWLPWPLWVGVAMGLSLGVRRRGREAWTLVEPWGVLLGTLGGMVVLYGLTSQETRFLLTLAPVIAWEAALLGDRLLRRTSWPASARAAALAAPMAVAVVVWPGGTPGDHATLDAARREAPRAAALSAELAQGPPGPVFTDNAAVLWLSDRRGVWMPRDAQAEAEIRRLLPELGAAPWVRLRPLDASSPTPP